MKGGLDAAGQFHRQPGLAGTAGPSQGQQTVIGKEALTFIQLMFPAKELGQLSRQSRCRRDTLKGWERRTESRHVQLADSFWR